MHDDSGGMGLRAHGTGVIGYLRADKGEIMARVDFYPFECGAAIVGGMQIH